MDHDAIVHALRLLAADPSCRLATLERLQAELSAQTLRDLAPTAELYVALFTLLPAAWASFEPEPLRRLHAWTRGVLALPEFSEGEAVESAAAAAVTAGFVGATLERMASLRPTEEQQHSAPTSVGAARAPGGPSASASGSDTASELAALQALLHWAYRLAVPVRAPLRAALGTALLKMAATAPVPPPAVRSALELLSSIIAGFGEITTAAHRRLLSEVLLPLHLPAARLDGTSPVLGLYHEPLVQCLVRLLGRQPALLTDALPPLLAGWPQPREGNSSKEVRTAARLSPRDQDEMEGPHPFPSPTLPSRPHPHADHSPSIPTPTHSPHPVPPARCCCYTSWSTCSSSRRSPSTHARRCSSRRGSPPASPRTTRAWRSARSPSSRAKVRALCCSVTCAPPRRCCCRRCCAASRRTGTRPSTG